MAGKMVLSIIHPDDAQGLIEALNKAGYRVTRMSTTGGFLRQGNTSLMIGVDETQIEQVLETIRANTRRRSKKGWWGRPGKHTLSAATVFVLDMEQVTPPQA